MWRKMDRVDVAVGVRVAVTRGMKGGAEGEDELTHQVERSVRDVLAFVDLNEMSAEVFRDLLKLVWPVAV